MQIQSQLVALEDAYPRRPRAKYARELIQMDASSFVWFGAKKTTLHVAIDDATGRIVGTWFDKEETLNGYYHVFSQILHSSRSFIPMVSLTSFLQTEELYSH